MKYVLESSYRGKIYAYKQKPWANPGGDPTESNRLRAHRTVVSEATDRDQNAEGTHP